MRRLGGLVVRAQRLTVRFQFLRVSLAAGGLAYFVALSIAPAALALGTLAGLVLDPQQVRTALDRLAERAPETTGSVGPVLDALVSTVEGASATTFTLTTAVGFVIAVYAASKVVLGLRMALDAIFGVDQRRSGLLDRAVSAVVTLVGLVAAAALVVAVTVVPVVLSWFGVDGAWVLTWPWPVNVLVWGALTYLVVRWTLAHAPNGGQPVGWASPGAAVATAGILLATAGVGVFAHMSRSLSAAVLVFGTAVVVLLWLYLCFVALLWGALIEAELRDWPIATATSADPPPAP